MRHDNTGMFWEFIGDIIHAGNAVAIYVGIDTAAIGAAFLNMYQDSQGNYHASFDCWQQYFGYNDFYDLAFDIGTSMKTVKFEFSYNGNPYTIWAWKGDYVNLGAGAELGIYRGSNGQRTVDTSLAMNMSLLLRYKGNLVMRHLPAEDQWWITGFNPKY